ncbi:MAG TPA: cold shock domain-containing protein [Bryobacteraceae bacterium]|nr:cold shock domain-containing protein [Bryobacteraceae bacterium]
MNEEYVVGASYEGSVKFFNSDKGYGFVEEPGFPNLFFHFRGLAGGRKSIDNGARVRFTVIDGRRGPEASGIEEL